MQHPNRTKTRRVDIDLLRAVAVLAVLFFHFDIPGFQGGFLGVDIFFVISGYLITLHIKEQLAASSFSFPGFYLRRIRRLFPALFATLMISSFAALFLFPKALLEEFTASQIASAAYVSNVYFWMISDYFDTESIVKPLLHTWSLSVEEQFYLVWPLFIVFFFKKRLSVVITLAMLASLFAAEIAIDHTPSTVFYLFPFRIFEFSIGAIASGISLSRLPHKTGSLLVLASVSTIILTFLIATEHSRHPGFATLPLCAATACLIMLEHPLANRTNTITNIFLRIGLVSYSLYLVHWPLVVFYKVRNPGELEFLESILLLLVSVVLAELLYRLVEKPTGRINLMRQKGIVFSILPTMLVFSLVAHQFLPVVYHMAQPEKLTVTGILDRIPDRRDVITDAKREIENIRSGSKGPELGRIIVVGDSHAVDLSLALQLQPSLKEYSVVLRHSVCDPLDLESIDIPIQTLYKNHPQAQTRTTGYCLPYHQEFLSKLVALKPDLVIFSEAWREETLDFLEDTVRLLKRKLPETVILLTGRMLQFKGPPNVIFGKFKSIEEINSAAWELRWDYFDSFDPRIREIAERTGTGFLSKQEIICHQGTCDVLRDGQVTFSDAQHWSLVGLRLFGSELISHPVFSEFLHRQSGT